MSNYEGSEISKKKGSAIVFSFFLLSSGIAGMQVGIFEASATTNDQDADGLPYGIEFLINTQPQDWDYDTDGLPDGWEWQYGLDPNDGSSLTVNGASGDPDADSMSNLQEYSYLSPPLWDSAATPNVLDNGVWWNGTVPVRNWNEEDIKH